MTDPDLFSEGDADCRRPLADRMRPLSLDEFQGQNHLLAKGKPLRLAIESDHPHSMIFWGPPGTGKTTLARILAERSGSEFLSLSAVMAGVKDIREAVERAREVRRLDGRATLLFIDEVHRFNKAQQDAFLPHVEDGTLVFIGATTENPSFELNNALLSRARIYVLKPLEENDLEEIIRQAVGNREKGLGDRFRPIAPEQTAILARFADGDARRALNLLEIAADLSEGDEISAEATREAVSSGFRRFDQRGEYFYDQISALHKSVRGSSPDAALYWLCRMLDGGCDPLYIARRVVRMASEDIGNADPRALALALQAWETQERLGSPEGELSIAQAVTYLACAPKSNAVYRAFEQAKRRVREAGSLEVPLHLRNAPTRLMKDLEYGRGYRYPHDEPDGYAAGEKYFPVELGELRFYEPVERGLEIKIREKLERLRRLNDQSAKKKPEQG